MRNRILLFILLFTSLSGCDVVGDAIKWIFTIGFWLGVILVLAIAAGLYYLYRKIK